MDNHTEIHGLLFSLLFELKFSIAKSLKDNGLDLAPMHQKALAYFSHFPGATQQDMADHTGRDKAQITRLLTELEKRRLISRQRDITDKRSYRIQITKRGQAACEVIKQREKELARKVLDGFSEEEITWLKASLEKMRDNLNTDYS